MPEDFQVFNRLISVVVDKRPGGDEKLVIKKLSISHQEKMRAATTLLFILFLAIYFLATAGQFDFGDDFGFVLAGAGSKRVFETL